MTAIVRLRLDILLGRNTVMIFVATCVRVSRMTCTARYAYVSYGLPAFRNTEFVWCALGQPELRLSICDPKRGFRC